MHAKVKLSKHWIHTELLSKHIGLNQPHFIREQKGLSSQNQGDDTIALAASNYVGHQFKHVLAIIEEPVNFLGGRVHIRHCLGLG